MSQYVMPRPAADAAGAAGAADAAGAAVREKPGARDRFLGAEEKSWRPVVLLLALLAAWWVIAAAELVEAYLVPSPGATLDVLTQKTSYLTL